VASLYFIPSGYEHCIFNLIEHNQNATVFSRDFVESLILKSQGNQAWTVQTDTGTAFKTNAPIEQRPHLKHISCTISIVVAANNCSVISLGNTLATFLVLEQNVLMAVISTDSPCSHVKLRHPSLDYSYKFLIFKNFSISSVQYLCSTCSDVLNVEDHVNLRNLRVLFQISSWIKAKSMERSIVVFDDGIQFNSGLDYTRKTVLAFQFMYKHLINSKLLYKIGGNPEQIFIQNAALFLNVSLVQYNFKADQMKLQQYVLARPPHHFMGITILTQGVPLTVFWTWGIVPPTLYTALVVRLDPVRYLYCVKHDEREGFSFMFWTVPLDTWSWVGLGLSCGFLTLQLRGQWFQIYSILMRQSCTILERNRILIIFILATIIFTYGYEGVISSFLTVPPPIIILKTVRELIGSGYKIMLPPVQNYNYSAVLQRDNISYDAVILGNSTDLKDLLHECKIAAPMMSSSVETMRNSVEDQHMEMGIKCHGITDTWGVTEFNYFFFGHLKKELYKFGCSLIESGILDMMHTYQEYITELFYSSFKIRRKNIIDFENSQQLPLVLSDWKILSIFLGLAFLLIMAALVFSVEIGYQGLKKQVDHIVVIVIWGFKNLTEASMVLLSRLSRNFELRQIVPKYFWKNGKSKRNSIYNVIIHEDQVKRSNSLTEFNFG